MRFKAMRYAQPFLVLVLGACATPPKCPVVEWPENKPKAGYHWNYDTQKALEAYFKNASPERMGTPEDVQRINELAAKYGSKVELRWVCPDQAVFSYYRRETRTTPPRADLTYRGMVALERQDSHWKIIKSHVTRTGYQE